MKQEIIVFVVIGSKFGKTSYTFEIDAAPNSGMALTGISGSVSLDITGLPWNLSTQII